MMIRETTTTTALQFFLFSSCFVGKLVDNFVADASSIKMDYMPIGHARVDPILSDTCVSDHVHTFYGPQLGVDPRRVDSNDKLEIHRTLVNTPVSENTGNVEENKSLYWHPTVYKYDRTTKTYTRDVMYQSSAYYVWDPLETTAFPDGFRMIGGFDHSKSKANAECVNPSPCDDGDCYTENDFFPSTKCDELEVSMRMPNCWDGVSLDSPPSHTSHVTYSDKSEFWNDCPASHPIKIPQIQLFFRISPYDGGWHTFSDMSSIYHADYVSGWESGFLQNVLDKCDNEGAGAMPNFFCENFLTYRDAPKCTKENECDFADPELKEKILAFQPNPPLDVTGTIVAEETAVVTGSLPRGTCKGSLVGGGGDDDDTPVDPPVDPPVTQPPVTDDCVDDAAFLYKDDPEKNCEWIKTNNPKLCKKRSVKKACPKSCDKCPGSTPCKDDPKFKYKGRKGKNCKWVKRKLKKDPKLCGKKSDGEKVKDSCPVACGAC